MAQRLTISKAQIKAFMDGIGERTDIIVPEGGWSMFSLLSLAGAAYVAAMRLKCGDMTPDQHREQQEADWEQLGSDFLAAVVCCGEVACDVASDEDSRDDALEFVVRCSGPIPKPIFEPVEPGDGTADDVV